MFSLQICELQFDDLFLLGNRESSGGSVPSGKISICFCTDPGHITVSIKSILTGTQLHRGRGSEHFWWSPTSCSPGAVSLDSSARMRPQKFASFAQFSALALNCNYMLVMYKWAPQMKKDTQSLFY